MIDEEALKMSRLNSLHYGNLKLNTYPDQKKKKNHIQNEIVTLGSSEKQPRIIQQPHWILHSEESEVSKWLSNSVVGNLQLAPPWEQNCKLTN